MMGGGVVIVVAFRMSRIPRMRRGGRFVAVVAGIPRGVDGTDSREGIAERVCGRWYVLLDVWDRLVLARHGSR